VFSHLIHQLAQEEISRGCDKLSDSQKLKHLEFLMNILKFSTAPLNLSEGTKVPAGIWLEIPVPEGRLLKSLFFQYYISLYVFYVFSCLTFDCLNSNTFNGTTTCGSNPSFTFIYDMNAGMLFYIYSCVNLDCFYILMPNNNRDILYFNFYLQGLLPK
jgi:hypothetical protein